MGGMNVGDDHLEAADRPWLAIGDASADGDRTVGTRWRELHKADVSRGARVVVRMEPHPVGVKSLGTIDIRNRNNNELELPIHNATILLSLFAPASIFAPRGSRSRFRAGRRTHAPRIPLAVFLRSEMRAVSPATDPSRVCFSSEKYFGPVMSLRQNQPAHPLLDCILCHTSQRSGQILTSIHAKISRNTSLWPTPARACSSSCRCCRRIATGLGLNWPTASRSRCAPCAAISIACATSATRSRRSAGSRVATSSPLAPPCHRWF